MAKKLGYRLTATLSIVVFSATIFLASFIKSYWGFMLMYSVIPPFVLGLAYMIPLNCGWAYFPQHKGKVTGIISTAFGLSTSLFNIIATDMVNP